MAGASEHQEQVAIFDWAGYQSNSQPELALLHAIPNGGLRNVVVAKKLKAEGVKSGVPDICLPVPRGEYHGLYVELKAKKGKLSENQKGWVESLIEQGYAVEVCFGADAAITVIKDYLKL